MKPILVATPEEIRTIFRRAMDVFVAAFDEDYPFTSKARLVEHNRAVDLVVETVRFCACAAAELGDPSLADLVAQGIQVVKDHDDRTESHERTLRYALFLLLEAGAQVTDRIRELARGPDAELRRSIAAGLKPRGDVERALLQRLAADPVAEVRKAARESLRAKMDLPWWTGKWRSDPAARILPGEEERLGPALRRVSEILDLQRSEVLGREGLCEELFELLAELPDDLAVEALEQLCLAGEPRSYGESPTPLYLQLFARDGALAALLRMIEVWGTAGGSLSAHVEEIQKALCATPPETRAALCAGLLDFVVAAPAEARWTHESTPAKLAASVVGKAWPPEASLAPVLDALLRKGEEAAPELDEDWDDSPFDRAMHSVSDALKVAGADPAPVLDRLVEGRLAGYPGAWKSFRYTADELLDRAPPEALRRAAERALAADDAGTIRWGAERLLGQLFDPQVDGPPIERVRALFEQPRLRAALVDHPAFAERALALMRPLLRRGELGYREAVQVVRAIGQLYGGVASPIYPRAFALRNMESADQIEASFARAREEHAAFLPPPELAGPVTPAEWEALSRARSAYVEPDLRARAELWTWALVDGPWTAEERAELDVLFAAVHDGHKEIAMDVARALGSKPDLDLMPMFDQLVTLGDADQRSLLRHLQRCAQVALGLRKRGTFGAYDDDDDDDENEGEEGSGSEDDAGEEGDGDGWDEEADDEDDEGDEDE
jgi:hypothetical protein